MEAQLTAPIVGTLNEHLLLKYLIFGGFVLKKSSINTLKDDSGRTVESDCRQMAELLLTCPRDSRNLEISIF
ncbi:hypothetical protein JHK87_038573 [Glycine soja]|nr:hypothetical protein JHK87_038573 [Glycine soja]